MQTKQIGSFFLDQYKNAVSSFSQKAARIGSSYPNANKYIFDAMEDVISQPKVWDQGVKLFGEPKMSAATDMWGKVAQAQNSKNLKTLGNVVTDEQVTNAYETLANMLSDSLNKWNGL